MSHHKLRAKEGNLEMLKAEGLKKKWRSFLFKVSAQTYLLCFRLDSPAKPTATMLLAHVLRIDTAAVREASFPFAVHFKGKGSPWVLNATNNAQRIEWMEAIQPGSGATLARLGRSATFPSHQRPPSPPPVTPPVTQPVIPEAAQQGKLNSSWPPQRSNSSDELQTAIRLPEPQEYMEPVPIDPAKSLPAGILRLPATPPKPRRSLKVSCQNGGSKGPREELPPKPKPRPRQRPPTPTTSQAPEYLPLVAEEGGAEAGKGEAQQNNSHVPEMVERMAQTFSPSQIGLLIEMLRELQPAAVEQPPQPAGTYEDTEPSVLRGDLERALEAAPNLQSHKMLVTDATSSDSYEPRPAWAKAVCEDSKRVHEEDDDRQDLDLTDLLAIPRSNLSNFNLIGEGQFGQVFKATLQKGAEVTEVAVKTTKAASSEKDKDSFMREMRIMSHMMHPNIVRLYGLVQDDVVSPWIILEFLPHGDLKTFLSKNKRPVSQLVKFMVDIAMGMHYLSERGLIHRDLAARNVLVGTNELCKVADFGLLRELPRDDSIYHMQTSVPCPVRWMPPESISQRKFSTASDVWSYGVLLWEMFHPRKMPYEKYSNIEVATKVIQGYRMAMPRACPSVVARIMRACWHSLPEKRPSFLLISTLLTTQSTFDP